MVAANCGPWLPQPHSPEPPRSCQEWASHGEGPGKVVSPVMTHTLSDENGVLGGPPDYEGLMGLIRSNC